jgi:hypothetical protein
MLDTLTRVIYDGNMNSNPQAQSSGTRRRDSMFVVAGVIWMAVYCLALWFLKRPEMPAVVKVAMIILPVIPFAFFLFHYIGHVRSMDELQRRVHLEGLALAFPIAILFLMTLGLIEKAGALSPKYWSYQEVWYYLPIFYLIGTAIASRRYR